MIERMNVERFRDRLRVLRIFRLVAPLVFASFPGARLFVRIRPPSLFSTLVLYPGPCLRVLFD